MEAVKDTARARMPPGLIAGHAASSRLDAGPRLMLEVEVLRPVGQLGEGLRQLADTLLPVGPGEFRAPW